MTRAVLQEYDRIAPEYERRWRSYVRASLAAVVDAVEAIGPRGGAVVLDVACGTGALEAALRSRNPDLTLVGADLSAGMLREARSKPRSGPTSWVRAEASRLPFGASTFDLVLCASSFHYFPRPGRSIAELARVLRPGGRLVLVDWCDDYLACRLCDAWLRLTDAAHQRTYTLAECRALLGRGGLAVESAGRFRISWIWGLMRLVARRH